MCKFTPFAILIYMNFSDGISGLEWLAIIALVLAFIVLWRLILRALAHAHHRQEEISAINSRRNDPAEYAFIVNPSKPGAQQITEHILAFCRAQGVPEPLIIETQLDKDGEACAQEAIARGAQVIVAVGGDGTVRTVAAGVEGTNHPLAVIPIGTANLFARNLGIPLKLDDALRVALSHGSRRVDMGCMSLPDSHRAKDRRGHGFLLISGIGFDATMMATTDPRLKGRMGWLAYGVAGMKHLFDRKQIGTIAITDRDGDVHTFRDVQFRTFLVGNFGAIPMVSLMPEADYSDGLLDFELLDTDGGIIGWANLAQDLFYQTIWGRSGKRLGSVGSTVDHMQGTHAEIWLNHSAYAEVDGDLLSQTKHVSIEVHHRSLIVRVPRKPAQFGVSTSTSQSVSKSEK